MPRASERTKLVFIGVTHELRAGARENPARELVEHLSGLGVKRLGVEGDFSREDYARRCELDGLDPSNPDDFTRYHFALSDAAKAAGIKLVSLEDADHRVLGTVAAILSMAAGAPNPIQGLSQIIAQAEPNASRYPDGSKMLAGLKFLRDNLPPGARLAHLAKAMHFYRSMHQYDLASSKNIDYNTVGALHAGDIALCRDADVFYHRAELDSPLQSARKQTYDLHAEIVRQVLERIKRTPVAIQRLERRSKGRRVKR